MRIIARMALLGLIFLLPNWVLAAAPWNMPYPDSAATDNTFYSAFDQRPKTFDPARSYSNDETLFVAQIYEPPLQYHYLKRPYTLIPLTATQLPLAVSDQNGRVIYTIHIKPGLYYQPHPAFAKDAQGQLLYAHLTLKQIARYKTLADFTQTGTRELTADDYIYEIKRLASPKVQSPIFGVMGQYIQGLSEYGVVLAKAEAKNGYLDLRAYDFPGVKKIDRYTYQIILKQPYPQFINWLAMSFFAPIPWEADQFYSQPGMSEHNISFDWYPVGTGAYQLTENNPNRRIVLNRNPNFHFETYPTEGEPGDAAKGYLAKAGQPLPFIDRYVFTLDKESLPRWNKFLQGYYDQTGVSTDSFGEAIHRAPNGQMQVSALLKAQGMYLTTSVEPSLFYMGFNMLDPIVGGYTEDKRKLRQAISIAMNEEEFINIFLNGRGQVAQGPLPPGIFGFVDGEAGMNPYVYQWQQGRAQRQSIERAKQLLAQAGYPNGIDPKTQAPLILNYDTPMSAGPDDAARFAWLRKQFAKLGIQLQVRATLYNYFQEKMRSGNAQIFTWGWLADYPDPENFLFLLYGPYGKVKHGGENASNYENTQFDALFEKMKNRPNDAERAQLIQKMVAIAQADAPWDWGYFPQDLYLSQAWVFPNKPNAMAYNTLKYRAIDPKMRAELRVQWNQPHLGPLIFIGLGLALILLPVVLIYRRKQRLPAERY